MIKRFICNYLWFWKESFSFMNGYSKLYIAWGCLVKSIPFCVAQEQWYRVENKELAYALMDRTIEFDSRRWFVLELCPKCKSILRIGKSYYTFENDDTPDEETIGYTNLPMLCVNKKCERYCGDKKEPIRTERHKLS